MYLVKRIIFLNIISLVFTFNSHGQSWLFGPELGANVISVNNYFIGKSYSLGWHTGAYIELELNEYFAINTGVYYTQKKHNYNSIDTTILPILSVLDLDDFSQFDFNTYVNSDGRITLNFIEIPLLAKVKLHNFTASAGIYGSILFKAKSKEIINEITPFLSIINTDSLGFISNFIPKATSTTESISGDKSHVIPYDFGTKFGISYILDRTELKIAYSLGLLDYRSEVITSSKKTNKYFQASICYNLGSKPKKNSYLNKNR